MLLYLFPTTADARAERFHMWLRLMDSLSSVMIQLFPTRLNEIVCAMPKVAADISKIEEPRGDKLLDF